MDGLCFEDFLRDDYALCLEEIGCTKEQVRAESEITIDLIDIQTSSVVVRKSAIEGMGLFSAKDFKAGDRIMPARIDGQRTQAGRYSNHSPIPNGSMEVSDNTMILRAVRDIPNGVEITTDYRHTYRLRGDT